MTVTDLNLPPLEHVWWVRSPVSVTKDSVEARERILLARIAELEAATPAPAVCEVCGETGGVRSHMKVPVVPARWMVFKISCIECGVSDIVGIYPTVDEANAVAKACQESLGWRNGVQNNFEVFDLLQPMGDEYRAAMLAAAHKVGP